MSPCCCLCLGCSSGEQYLPQFSSPFFFTSATNFWSAGWPLPSGPPPPGFIVVVVTVTDFMASSSLLRGDLQIRKRHTNTPSFFFALPPRNFTHFFVGPLFLLETHFKTTSLAPPLAKQRTIRNATRLSPGSDFTSARKDYKSLIFFSQIERTRMCNGRRPARERFSGEPARECPVGVSAPGAKCGPRRNLTKCQKKKACRTVARRRRRLRKTAGLAAKCYTIAGLGQEAIGVNIYVLFISK